MDFAFFNKILIFIINTVGIYLGSWIYFGEKKNKITQYFFWMLISYLCWIDLYYFMNYTNNINLAIWASKGGFFFVFIFIMLMYIFSLYFLSIIKKRAITNLIVIILGLLFSFVSIGTNLIEIGIEKTRVGYSPILSTPGKIILFGYVSVICFIIIWNFFKKYFYENNNKERKIRLQIFSGGILILIIGNIIFNVLLPLKYSTFDLSYFGNYSIIFFLGFTAYAIVKHQLFNIKVIATQTTVVALSIGLIIEIFLSNTLNERLLKLLVWVLTTYGGYVLVKSVQVEIKQKEELANLANALEDANTKLQELDEAKDNFLSMASHELNTPIAAIEGYLSMIIDENMAGNVNVKMKRYLNSVFISSKRLAALVRDLLNVSRIESNRIHIIYTEGHIEDTIQQAIDEVKIKADEVGHKLTFKKPDHKLPKTWFDQARITEVIINFIGNSIKYTEPGGKIVVSAHADDNKIVVSVTDNGRGIPDDRSGHIFEKFAQVDVMKDQVKGTGLGMFISKNLIELHKGKIWFKSSVDPDDHGTTFYFSLPILKEKPFDKFDGQGEVISLK